ncbi:MAG: DNA polymerase III subunit delta, partial [Fervidobacterium sp.]
MVFYLTGDSVLQKNLFIKQFLSEHPEYEYKKIFSDDANKIQELRNASESLGLFSNKKIYEIIDFDEWNESDKKEFLKISFPKNESLIIFVDLENIDNNIKKNENFENAKILNFEKPKEWNEKNWIDFILNTAKAFELNITEENALLIFQLVGPDELAISSELEKIKLISDNKKQILNEDIQSIIYKRVTSKLSEFSFSVSELQFEKARNLISEIFSEYDTIAVIYSLS